jgi:LysM repeat protein
MRSDMKIGLICVFAIVLGVVIYFVANGQAHPKTAAAAGGNGSASAAPGNTAKPEPAATPTPSNSAASPGRPEIIASDSGAMSMGPQLAQGSSLGGGFISPPGSPATAPAATTTSIESPTTPATMPGLGGGLPVAPATYPASSPFGPPAMPGNITRTPIPGDTLQIGGGANSGTSGLGGGLGTPSIPPIGNAGRATTYKIEKGDMLGTIAHKHGVSVKAIETANPGIDSTRLKIGAVINIPAPSSTPVRASSTGTIAASRPAATRPIASGSGPAKPGSSYIVKKGDTLSTIARTAYGDTGSWKKIFDANKSVIPDPNVVAVGTEIKIPQ